MNSPNDSMNASGALFISFFIPGVARDKVKVIIEATFANRFFLNVTPNNHVIAAYNHFLIAVPVSLILSKSC